MTMVKATSLLLEVPFLVWLSLFLPGHVPLRRPTNGPPVLGIDARSRIHAVTNDQAIDDADETVQQSESTFGVCSLSLQWTPDDTTFSEPVRQVWKWKDAVLGDGRDFFVPKPKTLSKLNQMIVESIDGVTECCVLSNCARFELLLVVEGNISKGDEMEWKNKSTGRNSLDRISTSLSSFFCEQVKAYDSMPFGPLQAAMSGLDRPGLLKDITQQQQQQHQHNSIHDNAKELSRYWKRMEGLESVCRHLCYVSTGLAPRPNRPDRLPTFRPFSSREAHILLQLKRTGESVYGSRTKQIVDAALRAGKMARDTNELSEIEALRPYGTDGKYSMDPPADVLRAVTDAAIRRVIEPTVWECVARFRAMEGTEAIVKLRKEAEGLATNKEELKWIRQQLHGPTMKLRDGDMIDVGHLVNEWDLSLEARRKQNDELGGKFR